MRILIDNGDSESSLPSVKSKETASLSAVVSDAMKVTEENANSIQKHTSESEGFVKVQVHKFMKYSRKELLELSRSPLVKIPDAMPPFKDWFGEWNDTSGGKKDGEYLTMTTITKDKRYRREGEEAETSSKPQYRAIVSQLPQMGNFRHQPLRSGDKDRDYPERDLRSLSDKYDREKSRLSMSSNAAGPEQSATLNPRRSELREAGKRRVGDSSEDWRRSTELNQSSREDFVKRNEYDDWDKRHSPSRGSSDQRNTSPVSRRARDQRFERGRESREDRGRRKSPTRDSSPLRTISPLLKHDQTDGEKDRYRRIDSIHRGLSDENPRREKDRERFLDSEEGSKYWQEDGKRDERIVGDRSKVSHSDNKEEHERNKVKLREHATKDKDTQKRARRAQIGDLEESKSKDKHDRSERTKQKEPPWMETYVPSDNAELQGGADDIQAWKTDMKEREYRAKALSDKTQRTALDTFISPFKPNEQPLDEIQLFKLMMKKEEQKRINMQDTTDDLTRGAGASLDSVTDINVTATSDHVIDSRINEQFDAMEQSHTDGRVGTKATFPSDSTISIPSYSTVTGEDVRLNEIPASGSTMPNLPVAKEFPISKPATYGMRPFVDNAPPFEPPKRSRLLAFGAQLPRTPLQQDDISFGLSHPRSTNSIPEASVISRTVASSSLATGQQETVVNFDYGHSDNGALLNTRREAAMLSVLEGSAQNLAPTIVDSQTDLLERNTDRRIPSNMAPLSSGTSLQPFDHQPTLLASANHTHSKGSRFAKFFDGKGREGQINVQSTGSSITPVQTSNAEAKGNIPTSSTDIRSFGDILAMLNQSVQMQQVNYNAVPQNGYPHMAQNPQTRSFQADTVGQSYTRPDFVDDVRQLTEGATNLQISQPRYREMDFYRSYQMPPEEFSASRHTPDQRLSGAITSYPSSVVTSPNQNMTTSFQQMLPFRDDVVSSSFTSPHIPTSRQRGPYGAHNLNMRLQQDSAHFVNNVGVHTPALDLQPQPMNQFHSTAVEENMTTSRLFSEGQYNAADIAPSSYSGPSSHHMTAFSTHRSIPELRNIGLQHMPVQGGGPAGFRQQHLSSQVQAPMGGHQHNQPDLMALLLNGTQRN